MGTMKARKKSSQSNCHTVALPDPWSGLHHWNIICKGKPDFRFTFTNKESTPRRIDAWIERNGKKRSRLSPFTPETTLGSICTGYESVVVANWNALRGQVSRNS